MPMSFSHIVLCLVTLPLLLLQLLQNCYCYFCYYYRYSHTTLLQNAFLQILSYPGVVDLKTQLLILQNILWLPLCRINKFGLNTLPSKTVVIPYTCGLSPVFFSFNRSSSWQSFALSSWSCRISSVAFFSEAMLSSAASPSRRSTPLLIELSGHVVKALL